MTNVAQVPWDDADEVIAAIADQDIAVGVTLQRVGSAAADQVLDRRQFVI